MASKSASSAPGPSTACRSKSARSLKPFKTPATSPPSAANGTSAISSASICPPVAASTINMGTTTARSTISFMHDRDGGFDWHRDDHVCRDEGYTTSLLGDEAVRLIEKHDTAKPLFLYVPFNAPHSPLQALPEYLE